MERRRRKRQQIEKEEDVDVDDDLVCLENCQLFIMQRRNVFALLLIKRTYIHLYEHFAGSVVLWFPDEKHRTVHMYRRTFSAHISIYHIALYRVGIFTFAIRNRHTEPQPIFQVYVDFLNRRHRIYVTKTSKTPRIVVRT